MVVHNVEGGQNPPFKINSPLSILIPTPSKTQHLSNWVCQRDSGFSRQTNDRQKNDIYSEIKLLWVCKLVYMPHEQLLQYKKVVMHPLANFLELVNLVEKLHHAVGPLVLICITLVHC